MYPRFASSPLRSQSSCLYLPGARIAGMHLHAQLVSIPGTEPETMHSEQAPIPLNSISNPSILSFHLLDLNVFIYYYGVYICTLWEAAHVKVHPWRSETTLWNQFSPPTSTWVLGFSLRPPGLHSKCFLPLSLIISSSLQRKRGRPAESHEPRGQKKTG